MLPCRSPFWSLESFCLFSAGLILGVGGGGNLTPISRGSILLSRWHILPSILVADHFLEQSSPARGTANFVDRYDRHVKIIGLYAQLAEHIRTCGQILGICSVSSNCYRSCPFNTSYYVLDRLKENRQIRAFKLNLKFSNCSPAPRKSSHCCTVHRLNL